MTLQYFDIPRIYDQTDQGDKFIQVLADTDNVDIFQHKAVQVIVNHQWEYWRVANKWLMLIPYLIQLFLFWLWSNFLLTNHAKNMAKTQITKEIVPVTNNAMCASLLVLISIYKIILEIIQFKGGLNIARERGHGCCKFW
jgi:hypothetical protein